MTTHNIPKSPFLFLSTPESYIRIQNYYATLHLLYTLLSFTQFGNYERYLTFIQLHRAIASKMRRGII